MFMVGIMLRRRPKIPKGEISRDYKNFIGPNAKLMILDCEYDDEWNYD